MISKTILDQMRKERECQLEMNRRVELTRAGSAAFNEAVSAFSKVISSDDGSVLMQSPPMPYVKIRLPTAHLSAILPLSTPVYHESRIATLEAKRMCLVLQADEHSAPVKVTWWTWTLRDM